MILAAAIRDKSGAIWTLPPPARHHDIGRMMIEAGHPAPYPSGDNQGFLVQYDGGAQYVWRATAANLAFEAGQIKQRKNLLYSEDLW